jgi:hypothetical protein
LPNAGQRFKFAHYSRGVEFHADVDGACQIDELMDRRAVEHDVYALVVRSGQSPVLAESVVAHAHLRKAMFAHLMDSAKDSVKN